MQESETPARRPGLFQRDFTLVVIGQIISLFGNSILRFALPLYILDQSGSAALFGAVSASAFLPMILLTPIGGIVADRVNKQRIMVVLDFSTAALVLGFLLLQGSLPLVPLMIVVLMLLYGIQGAYQPAVQASIPLLARPEQLVPANAVVNMVNSLASLLGPVTGGLLYGAYGLQPILVVGSGCFLFSAVMELFIRIPHRRREDGGGVWSIVKGDMSQSLHYILHENPILIRTIAIICLFNISFSSMLTIGYPVLITQTLGLSSQLYGYAEGALAVGGIGGGILAGVLGKKLDIRRSYLLLIACAAGTVPMGLSLLAELPPMASYLVITVMGIAAMGCGTLFSVQMLAFVQMQCPAELVGKVLSCLMALSMCSQPVGQALYGVLFERLGSAPWLVILASAAVSAGIGMFSKSSFRRLG